MSHKCVTDVEHWAYHNGIIISPHADQTNSVLIFLCLECTCMYIAACSVFPHKRVNHNYSQMVNFYHYNNTLEGVGKNHGLCHTIIEQVFSTLCNHRTLSDCMAISKHTHTREIVWHAKRCCLALNFTTKRA